MATANSEHSHLTALRHGTDHRAAGKHHGSSHASARSRVHPPARRARLPRLWHFAAEYLLLLPAGALIALIWANTAPESYFRAAFRLDFIVNDVLMVLFFGLMTKEVVEATAPGGMMHSWRRVLLPLVAAAVLTVVSALAYAAVVPWFEEPRLIEGWPAVFAIDLAFGYFVARIVFGRHPVVPFFVLLAICANAIGFAALAVAAAPTGLRIGVLVLVMTAAIAAAAHLRRTRVKSFWPYVIIGGGVSWCALYLAGLEPALALVPIVPFLPHAARDPGFFVDAEPSARDTLSRFELWCRHPAQVALFLFGLVNAGVPLQALYWGAVSLPVATLVKPAALLIGVGAALALGLHLPHRVGWRELIVVGFITSIGFTVALFFATAALGPGPTLSALRMGALASTTGALFGIGAAIVLRTGRFARKT
jgi:NhaA family Na+:H+ antiporter